MSDAPEVQDIAWLLDELLRRDPALAPCPTVDDWWRAHTVAAHHQASSAHAAALGGFAADRTAFAFASGYVEAVRHLIAAPEVARRALCATEAGGGHPRKLACRFEVGRDGGGRLHGDKTFVTLGDRAEELVVVASAGEDDAGRKRLRAVLVPATRAGVTVVALPELAFVPELSHARVELRDVPVYADEVLPGDGYLGVLKPFRTIEDVHVHLGLLGWLLRLGRAHRWNDEAIERTLALIATFVALASTAAPLSPGLHRALGAALDDARRHVTTLERSDAWKRLPESVRARWTRDRKLLDLAGGVRARRLESARAATLA